MNTQLYLQVSPKKVLCSLLLLHSVTPSFQISRACLCSSWPFHVAFPSFSASRAEEPRFLFGHFPLPIFSSCHCWENKNMNKLLQQPHTTCLLFTPWTTLHLLMLMTAVFPAFFSTWSHSSSSPRILYLKNTQATTINTACFDSTPALWRMKSLLILTPPNPFPSLSLDPFGAFPQTLWLLHSVKKRYCDTSWEKLHLLM